MSPLTGSDHIGTQRNSRTIRRKPVSANLPMPDFRLIRDEAIRQGIPMSILLEEELQPLLQRLRRSG